MTSKLKFSNIVIIFLILFLILSVFYYKNTRDSAINNANIKINELLLNYKAFRTYVSKVQKHEVYRLQDLDNIDIEYFNPKLLSSTYSARNVNKFYNQYRKEKNQEPIEIKFASNNPRNPINSANEKELELLKKFNNNDLSDYQEIITTKTGTKLFYAIPTKRTTAECMRCHSLPQSAPQDLVKLYGDKNGFHEEVGKIRAILTTIYPLDEDLKNANYSFIKMTLITFIIFAISLFIVYKFIKSIEKRNKKLNELNLLLDEKVAKRTKELEVEKEHIETIVESNNNAIIAIDSTGTIKTYNNKAQEIFGWSKDEMIGKKNLLKIIPDKFKQKYTTTLLKYFKTGILDDNLNHSQQAEGIHKNGTIFPIRISIGSKFKFKDTIVIANISDISQEIQQEKLIYQQSKMVSMGEMIGNIAHQWRQPLSVISTAASGMQIQKEFNILSDKQFVEACEIIDKNAQYLSKTIDDFRNFIKGDREKSKFNLTNQIDSFLHLVEGTIKNSDIDIILNLNDDIQIDGYENELTQCFINIFNNAKDILDEKDMQNKFIFITSSKIDADVIITIKDNAGGIPNDVLPKIFEPYFTTKHKSQGTGLGLHMTYNLIVDGMKGEIKANNANFTYNNENYTGAEFIIILPLS